jgi:hypothetical protein
MREIDGTATAPRGISTRSLLRSRRLEAELAEAGFRRPGAWSRRSELVVLVLLSVIIGMAIGSGLSSPNTEWHEVVATATALVLLGVGYQQWRASRQEVTLERYYERLELVNKRMDKLDGGWEETFAMLVYTELDNLEYVSEKYKLGYVQPEMARRALRHFTARCMDPSHGDRFRTEAASRVEAAGYEETTRDIVRSLCVNRPVAVAVRPDARRG